MINITNKSASDFTDNYSVNLYSILLFEGESSFVVNDSPYHSSGQTILFLSPYQSFRWATDSQVPIRSVQFHGDFYCIEYHKKEVACNGLLFNNIYLTPFVNPTKQVWNELLEITHKIESYSDDAPYSHAVVKTYLQLILALSSSEKKRLCSECSRTSDPETERFMELLDSSFRTQRQVAFYAHQLSISPNALSKKIKKSIGKTPTQLIGERVVLEAKKLLHLTYKPVKQIADELGFDDEFHFSRYFKNSVGISPLHYRQEVGISVVAQISIR